jgi:Zn-dependent peptidase ImmA (M78 family)
MARKSHSLELKRKCARLALNWCKKNFGINNRRKQAPKVSVRVYFKSDETFRKTKAAYYYSENRIIVYHINNKKVEDVVSAVIHEYTHYLQPDRKYWDYFKTHYYSQHPHERQAVRNEERYTEQCMCEITPLLY